MIHPKKKIITFASVMISISIGAVAATPVVAVAAGIGKDGLWQTLLLPLLLGGIGIAFAVMYIVRWLASGNKKENALLEIYGKEGLSESFIGRWLELSAKGLKSVRCYRTSVLAYLMIQNGRFRDAYSLFVSVGNKGTTDISYQAIYLYCALLCAEMNTADMIFAKSSDKLRELANNKNCVPAADVVGLYYYMHGNFAMALSYYDRAEKHHDSEKFNEFSSIMHKAWCLVRTGNTLQAQKMLKYVFENCENPFLKNSASGLFNELAAENVPVKPQEETTLPE